MKNKKLQIFIITILLFGMTGCTKYLKDDNKQIIKNEKTGQNITSNILCKPTDKDILNIYDKYNETAKSENKINIAELEECNDLKVLGGKYEGIWTTIFVKPLAWLIIKVGGLVKSYGLSIILTTLLIRLAVYPFTKKTAMQSENLKKAKPELDKLEKKYKNRTDNESMIQKSQEMMFIYKKYQINPMSGCLFSLIQIPLFFAFYEAIGRIPVIFEENFLGLFQLGTSPAVAAFTNGNYYYLIFILLIGGATYYSFKLNSGAGMGQENEQQMKTMTNVMVVIMTITAFSISTGIAIYWVTSNIFTIIQNLLVKRTTKNA